MIQTDETLLYSNIAEMMAKQDIDFVATHIISHWHAIGVDALVHSIAHKKNKKPAGVIVIVPHPKNGFVISQADFVAPSFATVEFFFLNNFMPGNRKLSVSRIIEFCRKEFDILLAIGNIIRGDNSYKKEAFISRVIYRNVDFLRVFKDNTLVRKYHPVFALIDEGLQTYMSKDVANSVRKLHTPNKRAKSLAIITSVETMVSHICYHLLEFMAVKCINTENRFVFHKEQGRLIPNESVVNSYKSVIVKRGEVKGKVEKTSPLAIILTQPFSEYGQVSFKYELDLIENVIDILLQTGFDILLKPHPRETIGKYDPVLTKFESERVKLSYHKEPAESLFPSLDPDCIIGYTSTALLIANTMYNIPAISIIDMLSAGTEDEFVRLHRNEFEKLTREISHSADNYKKLKQILASIKGNGDGIGPNGYAKP